MKIDLRESLDNSHTKIISISFLVNFSSFLNSVLSSLKPETFSSKIYFTSILLRASKAVVLIGQSEYLVKMIENNKTVKRYSNLAKKLRKQNENN